MPTEEWIRVHGAREHNLKSVEVSLPKNSLVVITGVSGSGKSSLAFDTIFSEGQRRYVESLSAYARQFLGQLDKPDVDSIEGLSPAIAIDQKSTHNNPRSTVGTITEIYDHLRLLYGRVGRVHCPKCGVAVSKQSLDQMLAEILEQAEGEKGMILAPITESKKGEHISLIAGLKKEGYMRVRVNGQIFNLEEEELKLVKNRKHDIDVVIDRVSVKAENRTRLADSLTLALAKGSGVAKFLTIPKEGEEERLLFFSQSLACPNGHGSLITPSPRLFSFNSPDGACADCHGLGNHKEFDPDKVVPDPNLPLVQAILPWSKSTTSYYVQLLNSVAKANAVKPGTRWKDLPDAFREIILNGSDEAIELSYDSYDGNDLMSFFMPFEGVLNKLKKKYRESKNDKLKADLEEFMSQRVCATCNGARIRPEAIAVKVGEKNIAELTLSSLERLQQYFGDLKSKLSPYEFAIAERLLQEISDRLCCLNDLGLGYLSLSRTAGSLSGGEAQRIRLATQIGSGLAGVLYVLDEPSIGLHQRDNDKLIGTLHKLKALGNTVLVVEHDEDTIRQADWIVDVGPLAGKLGGNIVGSGSLEHICAIEESLTGQFMSGRRSIAVPSKRRAGSGKSITASGACLNNLQDVRIEIPLAKFVCVTGVSGSGKSSLIMDLLLPQLKAHTLKQKRKPTGLQEVLGLEELDKVIEIDQSPIGRTPHSNPATYTGAFTPIRELFACMPDAKMRGYGPGHFSFNVRGGRCEACNGQGHLEIEMNFLPSVFVKCEVCQGRRYTKEVLSVEYKGFSIADVLEMTVEQACEVFANIPSIANRINTLAQVGLGYISLGQSATTLSGGEAQRVKLATELSKRQTGRTIYLLDEPTTGLHWYDIEKLLAVLNELVDHGNTVLVIEHNLDVIKQADWVIDMGPEGGEHGGRIVAEGEPEKIAACSESYTGKYLTRLLPAAALSVKTRKK